MTAQRDFSQERTAMEEILKNNPSISSVQLYTKYQIPKPVITDFYMIILRKIKRGGR